MPKKVILQCGDKRGTVAGYARHRNATPKQDACPQCLQARRTYSAEYRKKNPVMESLHQARYYYRKKNPNAPMPRPVAQFDRLWRELKTGQIPAELAELVGSTGSPAMSSALQGRQEALLLLDQAGARAKQARAQARAEYAQLVEQRRQLREHEAKQRIQDLSVELGIDPADIESGKYSYSQLRRAQTQAQTFAGLYVVEFSCSTVKIGRSSQVHIRIERHAADADQWGRSITRKFMLPMPEAQAHLIEDEMVEWAQERAGEVRGREYFGGLDYVKTVRRMRDVARRVKQ